MSAKLKYEQLNKQRHGLEHPAKNFISPIHDAYEREAGQQTDLIGRKKIDKAAILELKQLLAQSRSYAFFVLSETQRKLVVMQIETLHYFLLQKISVEGYIDGSEFRQAVRLVESYGRQVRNNR